MGPPTLRSEPCEGEGHGHGLALCWSAPTGHGSLVITRR